MSSLATRVLESMQKRESTAKDRYFEALRAGDPDQIGKAALAAGIRPEQVTEDANLLEHVRELAARAEPLPALTKAVAEASRALEQANAAWDAALARIEPAARVAALTLQEAQATERTARAAMAQLVGVYADRADLLPRESAPDVLKDLWAREAKAQAESTVAAGRVKTLVAAKQRVQEIEKYLHHIQYGNWPFDVQGVGDRDALLRQRPELIAKAQAELKEAWAALEKLEAEAK